MNRKTFLQYATGTGLALFTANHLLAQPSVTGAAAEKGKRVGIIGLDTSHSIAFAKLLNQAVSDRYHGYKVVAAYPYGSKNLTSSSERIPQYTTAISQLGITVTSSIRELLEQVDVVLLETNDGRLHLEQALEVFRAGKPVFIDKPIAASLKDTQAIFSAATEYHVPVFSSSALRYQESVQLIRSGIYGKVMGADTYSPAFLEPTHPDLFWYGIHGVESLYALMGRGCESVERHFTPEGDFVTARWKDGRIGTFRGLRTGKTDFGGTCYCEKGIIPLGTFTGYEGLLQQIATFFKTGISPVAKEETLELIAFLEAAEKSKLTGGKPVSLQQIFDLA